MQNQFDPRTTTPGYDPAVSVGVPRATRDAGLRSYMLKVYNYMASGVLLTGIVAMLFANTSLINILFDTATGRPTLIMWASLFGSFGLGIWLQAGINRMSAATAQLLFWAYSGTLGMALTGVFLAYTGVSIAQTFFTVAVSFMALSLWGYTTKKDLSGWGTFLFMGVIGVFMGLLVNVGIAAFTGQPSRTLDLAVSAIGVLVFAGLTAYDTQKIKSIYYAVAGHGEATAKAAVYGAVQLYIDFINMFLFLLRFMGDRR